MNTLEIRQLNKVYTGKIPTQALTDINLSIGKGEFVGVMGPSGSGKTTLLNMISTIDTPSSGTVLINGANPYAMKKSQLALFRRRQLGFVFQDFNLIETLTIGENIVLPLTLDNISVSEAEARLNKVATRLGIKEILPKLIYEVSGGQRQRAAIARAMITNPSLVLADEPTGALDSNSARVVMESLESIQREGAATIVLVTHDPQAASYCSSVVFIKDGHLVSEIHRGDSRQLFYQKIMDTLSYLGGQASEVSSIRL